MDKSNQSYIEFINAVDPHFHDFVNELHDYLVQSGCKVQIKPTSSAYLVTYIITKTKKSVANFVFRKSGLILRIYGEGANQYHEFLDTLPDTMIETIRKAPVCKRLVNPEDCNPKCTMGYDFILKGDRYQKCRSSAFMFLIDEENCPYLKAFIEHEINVRNGV